MPERESYCKFLRWRKTSAKELEDIDQKVLQSVSSAKDKRFVPIGNDQQLWSVTCSPQDPGTATPLLLVHGMGGGVGLWALNLDVLSPRRTVHAFDLLGFGRSSRPSFSSDAGEAEDAFVQSIEKYRQAMGVESFILVGHSLGGYLSASYALQHPHRVKHLVLVDPWGLNPQPPEGRRQIPLFYRAVLSLVNLGNPLSVLRAAGPLGPRLVKRYRPGLAQMFADKLGDESLLHDYIYHCNAQKPSGETGFKSLTWNMGWAKQPMGERLVGLDPQVPVTFIYGSLSWMDRGAAVQVQKSRDSYVDVQIIRGAGHHVYAERWDPFNKLVNAVASSVDRGELPHLDTKTVRRLHDDSSSEPDPRSSGLQEAQDLDLQCLQTHPDGTAAAGHDDWVSEGEVVRETQREGGGGDQRTAPHSSTENTKGERTSTKFRTKQHGEEEEETKTSV